LRNPVPRFFRRPDGRPGHAGASSSPNGKELTLQSKWLIRALGTGLAAALVSAVTATAASASATITGAGSTLIAPLEQEWASAFQAQNANISVTYSAVGSGAGLKDIGQKLVDFGASDAPLSASSTACPGCYQMPWALSATGIGYHLNGVRSLHLTGPVLAQIYLGQIKKWNDPRIQRLQKRGVRLPNLAITVYWRSDGSGDTYAYTDYLSRVSGSFKHTIGNGTTVSWPTGVGAKGNSGMVAGLSTTNGSIAYVAVSYLIADWPHVAAIRNAAGKYEVPNYSNIADAAQSVKSLPASNEVHIVNPPRRYKTAYPISTYTYVIGRAGDPADGLVRAFVGYAITNGQAFGPRLGFVPIPGFVKSADFSTLGNVQ
jgi:phosphate transport system substrate-binding protein